MESAFQTVFDKLDNLTKKVDKMALAEVALRKAYCQSTAETAALKATTPHSNGDPPPAFATTSTETIDFSIGFGFAALIYVSL
jgi:hypothetical protein